MKSCWRALGVVALGTSLVACIKIAPFTEKDAGGDAIDAPSDGDVAAVGAVAVPMGNGADVTNGALYRVGFSNDAFHFPYNMQVGTTQVIGGGQGIGCADELGVGIGLFPAARITGFADANTNVLQDDLTIEFSGPPVAKVSLDWGTQFPCGTSNGTVTGRSTFTFFPDGHINRSDQVHIGAALDGNMCTCSASGSGWYLTSFFTANHANVNTVFNATLPTDPVTSIGTTSPTVCFNGFGNAYQFAMGWRLPLSTRVRTPVAGDSGTIAFVRDLTASGTNPYGPGDLESQTTWWVATDSNCAAVSAKVFPYTDPTGSLPHLNIQPGTGQILSYGVALDGIFGGENGQGTMGYQSAAPDIHLTVDADIGAFAFWLALASGDDIASVTKTGNPPAPWYSQQTRNGSNHRLFWFPDGLKAGEEIVITIQ